MRVGDRIGTATIVEVAVVGEDAGTVRLDTWAATAFGALATRSAARKAAKRGELAVAGEVAEGSRWIQPGTLVGLLSSERKLPGGDARHPVDLRVVWEDGWAAVIEKPPGLPTSGFHGRTVERSLNANLEPSPQPDVLPWPKPVHRLDAPTGGLLVVAKTGTALSRLGQAFQNRLVNKRYRALVAGNLQGEGEILEPLDERACRTIWRAVGQWRCMALEWVSAVDLWPHTGRNHQLRRHLLGLGHPVLGDRRYAGKRILRRDKGLFLWAVELEFPHPEDGRVIRADVDPPPKFRTLVEREARRWEQRCSDS